MIYEVLLLIGLLGLVVQSLLGLGHGGAGGHHGGAGHGGAASGSHSVGHGHSASHSHNDAASGRVNSGRQASSLLLTILSPMTIFSLCIGAGAAGLIARALRQSPVLTILFAVAGAVFFYFAIVRPIASLVFRFASKPATTLAGAVATEAVATSRFDSRGRGVVRVNVDGQLVRVLANLEADEHPKAGLVAPGDKLLVTGIDKKKNACTVTRL